MINVTLVKLNWISESMARIHKSILKTLPGYYNMDVQKVKVNFYKLALFFQ